jgi:hypothetical protein
MESRSLPFTDFISGNIPLEGTLKTIDLRIAFGGMFTAHALMHSFAPHFK